MYQAEGLCHRITLQFGRLDTIETGALYSRLLYLNEIEILDCGLFC